MITVKDTYHCGTNSDISHNENGSFPANSRIVWRGCFPCREGIPYEIMLCSSQSWAIQKQSYCWRKVVAYTWLRTKCSPLKKGEPNQVATPSWRLAIDDNVFHEMSLASYQNESNFFWHATNIFVLNLKHYKGIKEDFNKSFLQLKGRLCQRIMFTYIFNLFQGTSEEAMLD